MSTAARTPPELLRANRRRGVLGALVLLVLFGALRYDGFLAASTF